MRNRAKCKLCESIIESFGISDYVECKCGEIAIDGGTTKYIVYANNFGSFLRVDDEGHEILVTVEEREHLELGQNAKMAKADLIKELEEMYKRLVELPPEAIYAAVTYADFLSLIMLITEILKSE